MSNHPAAWRIRFPGLFAKILLLATGTLLLPASQIQAADPVDFSTFKIISERNVFDPNRRPRITSAPAAQVVDSFSLTGTLIYGKGRFAVFDGTSSDYRKVLEPGGQIAGYAVTDINLHNATLALGTNQLELAVGKQMRRNEDGHWSIGERTDLTATYQSPDSSRRRSLRPAPGSPTPDRTSPENESPQPPSQTAGPDMAEGQTAPDTGAEQMHALPEPPPDENDPVARMMRRRAEEMNGNEQ